ncbi:hypothetical protein MACJ_002251 [Theileria orientalis]|uniref:Uncharacterized protein n=1 Tax=Theileria orientalis TaxID=68886 RepID=A0A976M5R0_THEOR|nr:hypothetical protein MACJ_002251 [Theileria orientalis]
MSICGLWVYLLIIYIKICRCIKISRNVPCLISIPDLNRRFEKTWLFINEIDPSAPNIIKRELLSQLKEFNLDDSTFTEASYQLDEISHKISDRILRNKNKFKLENLFILKEIRDVPQFLKFLSPFREDPVVYSIWNIKPHFIPTGAKLILEIQYRFPIKLKGVPTMYFSPVVTYKADFNPGHDVDSMFSNETITLDTDPLIPWKTHKVGSFMMYPPLVNFAFNVK